MRTNNSEGIKTYIVDQFMFQGHKKAPGLIYQPDR